LPTYDRIGANRSVPERPAWHGYGQSVIIGRDGQILAKAKNDLGNEILYAELFVAEQFPSLQYRGYASTSPQIQTCLNLAVPRQPRPAVIRRAGTDKVLISDHRARTMGVTRSRTSPGEPADRRPGFRR
jgi:hypothetical protein